MDYKETKGERQDGDGGRKTVDNTTKKERVEPGPSNCLEWVGWKEQITMRMGKRRKKGRVDRVKLGRKWRAKITTHLVKLVQKQYFSPGPSWLLHTYVLLKLRRRRGRTGRLVD